MSTPEQDKTDVALKAVDSILMGLALYENEDSPDPDAGFDQITAGISDDDIDFELQCAYQNLISYLLSSLAKSAGTNIPEIILDLRQGLLSKI